MRAYRAERAGKAGRLIGVVALLAGFGLSGCSDVDNALFGADQGGPGGGNAPGTLSSSAQAAPAPARSAPDYSTYPSDNQPAPGTMADQGVMASAPSGALISPVQIDPGSNTGTGVSNTIANLRSQMVTISSHVAENAQQLATLRAQNMAASTAYLRREGAHHRAAAGRHDARQPGARRRMEFGAVLARPALGQHQLAELARQPRSPTIPPPRIIALDQITATFNVSGAVDEDHRQLSVLEDETNQTIVLIDRLLRDVSDDVQRQTAYAAKRTRQPHHARQRDQEWRALWRRSRRLAHDGEHRRAAVGVAYNGTPLVVIRFDRRMSITSRSSTRR